MRICLIGVGGFGKVHLDALEKLGREGAVRLVGAAVTSLERHTDTLDSLRSNGVKIYLDYLKMAEEMNPDLIAISTGIHLHKDMTIKLLDLGFDVLVEKPPAPHVKDVEVMAEHMKKSGRLCVVGFNWQAGESIHKVMDEIFDGRMGRVESITGSIMAHRGNNYYNRNKWAGKIKMGDTYVFDGSINNPFAHILNISLLFASSVRGNTAEVRKVNAEMYRAHDIETEDTTSMRVTTKDGIDILFNTTTCADPTVDSRELDIECLGGRILWTNSGVVSFEYKDGQKQRFSFDENAGSKHQYNIYRNIVRRKKGDSSAYLYTVDQGINFTKTINAAFSSSNGITKIGEEDLIHIKTNNDRFTCIKDIEKIIGLCRVEKKQFSEAFVSWSKPSTDFYLEEGNNCDFFA